MISQERKRELATELVLEHARDIEFLSVCEHLGSEGIGDDSGDLAREIHDLATSATVTVEIKEAE